MKILVGILTLFNFCSSFAQEGDWRWISADERRHFELTITETKDGSGMEGQHCAVFHEGIILIAQHRLRNLLFG